MASATPKLFTPLTLGGKNPVQLQHRVVMAPLTRLRTGETGIPTDLVAEYYAQRSTPGGLIIAEATNISPTARGYFGAPGLFTSEQVEGWKKVTRAVHAKGGKIFVQLWHTGRVGHPLNQPNGVLPVSSSAVGLEGIKTSAVTREGRRKYVTPRALGTHEIAGVITDYKRAAENAIAAGFDGVELHGANGYLIEQFLCDGVNKRTDKYGGSIENRARLMFEALDAVLSSLDSTQVAIRLSPFGVTFRLYGLDSRRDLRLRPQEAERAGSGVCAHRGAARFPLQRSSRTERRHNPILPVAVSWCPHDVVRV
ncbi:hypothetical protein F443_05648 [Phytophthora nicotianae P1569]|uniref:NADH:flavin oxidoreductase/NADH oxidase N-terminal domain-containing protein n=1 Tax=Phytophthora nicotianae P1569 TaxID=1317065 RepID=V9FHJ4_PHYNI|nr:hypothetical protein F443_05648 [Phytophthora nicotianae P1569]